MSNTRTGEVRHMSEQDAPPLHHAIITFTLNPALDVSTEVNQVIPAEKLRGAPAHHEAGGGGINVARVAQRLGAHPVAIYAFGGSTGGAFNELVDQEHIATVRVPIAETTRESFTVTETDTGKQYRFVLEGPEMRSSEWQAMLDALEQTLSPGALVVASGSVPPGVPDDIYARVARLVKAQPGICVVDASGPALAAALAEGVFLVKPSLRELEQHVGRPLRDEASQRDAAFEIVRSGSADVVALSLGPDGAMLVTAQETLRLPAPDVQVRGTVGAGDSFVAGFVARLAENSSREDAFITAVAAGSATASCHSTSLCSAALVHELEAAIRASNSLRRL